MSRSCRKVCYFAPMLCVKNFPGIIQLPVPSLHLASVSFIPQHCFVFIHLLFGCHQAPFEFPLFCLLNTARYTGIELSFYIKPILMHLIHVAACMICHLLTRLAINVYKLLKLLLIFQHLFFLSLSLYLGGCCCLQPLNGLFAPRASIYLTPHITRIRPS